jgi:hypothetical protein
MEKDGQDSLKYHLGLPCPTLLSPAGGWPKAIFNSLGHAVPYTYASISGKIQKMALLFVAVALLVTLARGMPVDPKVKSTIKRTV